MPNPPAVIGVAVSGGSDSMALLHLLHGFCALHGSKLRAVTVDHGLRLEARREAAKVREVCAQLGVTHDTLLWSDWDGEGNLQGAAREARYRLMAKWADDTDVDTIALGHTADDQAETFVMRLARRSGVDGLSSMPGRTVRNGVTWVRPVLCARREALRNYLRHQQIDWVEDPSNDDMQFERVRTRAALTHLAGLGIDATALSEVAQHMEHARRALDWQTFLAARDLAEVDAGAIVLSERRLRILPEEIQRRLMVSAVNWISGSDYPPRRAAIANLMQALRKGQAGTLDGVQARRIKGRIWIYRELNAVRPHGCAVGQVWDDRWHIVPPEGVTDTDGLKVRPLDEDGILQCPDWRETGRPHDVLLSTPSIWKRETLVSAPLAGVGQTWHAVLNGGKDAFFAALLVH